MRRVARVLVYLGAAGVVLGLSKYHAAYIGHYVFTNSFRFAWAIAYIVLLALASYGAGLPDLPRTTKAAVLAALGSTAAAAVGISLFQLVVGSGLLPRFVVLGTPLILVPWDVVCWVLVSSARSLQEDRDRVVAVISLEEADALRTDLSQAPEKAASLVDALLLADARSDQPRQRPLVESVARNGATVVVLDREAQADESIVGQAAALHEAGVRVRTLTLFYDEWLGKLPVWELERVSLMFDIGEIHRARYGRLKRLADVAFGVIGLVPLVIALPVVIVANLVANRGPIFYRQERVGKNGTTFQILKFRTMRPDGHTLANEWTTEDDPRITPVGRVMRRTHLDELPQVVNVVRGDLSIVGPRPEQPRYVRELAGKIPFYDLRHRVRPGLTGWAQVKYGYAGTEGDALQKLQYEFFYLRHQSLALDARIVGRTIRHVVGRGGR
ncbi:MAG: sugar transferase [Acidimicrobiales bacterium]|nr:sugar transferase [Acidimicrobiales bacterium]